MKVSILLMCCFVYGCSPSSDDSSASTGVFQVGTEDPEMVAAIEKAQKTFGYFEQNWKNPVNDGCSLKFALPTSNGELEHIWFSPTSIEGDQVTGVCNNEPVYIPDLSYGDTRTVTRDDITDWTIMIGNTCYGGYTIRVLKERNPDALPPIEFEDPPEE